MKKINMFFIRDGEIAVFKLRNAKSGGYELELLKNQGEDFQKIDNSFWQWWEDKVGFLPSDECDFCFIWDKKDEIIFNEKFSEKIDSEIWDIDSLIGLLDFFKLEAKITSFNGNIVGKADSKQEFFTNLNIKQNKEIKTIKQNKQKQEIQKRSLEPNPNETKMQKYFREMRQREEEQRRAK